MEKNKNGTEKTKYMITKWETPMEAEGIICKEQQTIYE